MQVIESSESPVSLFTYISDEKENVWACKRICVFYAVY